MYKELDPLLHSQLRLAIMSILISAEEADFVFIRENTGATAGNLSIQIEKLKEAGYIEVSKTFRERYRELPVKKPPLGIVAFEKYVETLKSYIGLR